MKYLICVFLVVFSALKINANSGMFEKNKMFDFYKDYYKNDIKEFKENEKNIFDIFNQCYINNNFQMDFKIAQYAYFINDRIPNGKSGDKVALVVYMMKLDLDQERTPFYKMDSIELTDSTLLKLMEMSIKLMKNVQFVETKEEMMLKEKEEMMLKEKSSDNNIRYFIPKGCFNIVEEYIEQYK